jgi:hypothetical protein
MRLSSALQLEKLKELLGTYLKPEDIERVAAAFVRRALHLPPARRRRDPRRAGTSTPALMAALLHDVMEDTADHQGGDRASSAR